MHRRPQPPLAQWPSGPARMQPHRSGSWSLDAGGQQRQREEHVVPPNRRADGAPERQDQASGQGGDGISEPRSPAASARLRQRPVAWDVR